MATRVATLRAKLDRTRERSHSPRLPVGMAQRAEAAAIVSRVMDPAQHPLVTRASCDALSIEPFQQRHHDASRTCERLAQLTYCGGGRFLVGYVHPPRHFPQNLLRPTPNPS